MEWLGNQISRFIRLGLQEWQLGEFGLFWLVLTIRDENQLPFIFLGS